jgi:deoxyguanosine kinase
MTQQDNFTAEAIAGDALLPRRKQPAGTRQFSQSKPEGRPWIAIEGPLRVGKSTLAGFLAERMGATHIAEPEDNPFLERFYAGEPGMAFASQMWFLRQRIAQLCGVAKRRCPVVSDYILQKDKLFAHLTLSDAELAIYREYYAAHAPSIRPDLVVYLQAKPAILLERRRRKGVSAEQGLGAAYTGQLAEAYEHFFARYTGSRLLVVDTSAIDFVHSEREREMLLDRILAPVHGTEHFAPLAQIA